MTFYLQKEWCFMVSKKLTKVLACVLGVSCLLATTSALTISADETIGNSDTNTQVFILNEEDNGQPPVWYEDNGIMPCGATKPSRSDVWNLSQSPYNASIVSFKEAVYTNCCFTVPDGGILFVSISGDDIIDYINKKLAVNNHSYYFRFTLYKYNDVLGSSVVDSYQVTPLPTGSTLGHAFSGLESGVKYYVLIEKTVDYTYLNQLDLSVKLIQ